MLNKSVILFLGLFCWSIPQLTHADFESGLSAFEHNDYRTASQELRPLAEKGDLRAQYYIGFMHYHGRGVVQSSAEAVKWIRPAAEKGFPDAQYLYSLMLDEGLAGPGGKAEALKWIESAAELDHAGAQVKLADRYLRGQGSPHDLVQAYQWCRLAQLHVPPRCTPQEYLATYQLTAAQKDAAQHKVQTWITQHPVNAVQPQAKSPQQLINELNGSGDKVKEAVKATLIRRGDAAIPAILETFRVDAFIHMDLLKEVLCERGAEASIAIPELTRLFQDSVRSHRVRPYLLSSLACVGKTSPEVQSLMLSLLRGNDEDVRLLAVMYADRFDSKEVVLALAETLSDERRTVREAAAGALMALGPKAAPAVPALAKVMDQKGTYLAAVAGNALHAIGTPEAMAELSKHGVPQQSN